MNLFDTLKAMSPHGGTVILPTVRCDIPVEGAVLHVPTQMTANVSWNGDDIMLAPIGLEATVSTAIGPFPMRARVKVGHLQMERAGDVFAYGSWGFINRRFQLVDAGDA